MSDKDFLSAPWGQEVEYNKQVLGRRVHKRGHVSRRTSAKEQRTE